MSEYQRYLKYQKYINGVPLDEYKEGNLIDVVEADSQSDCEHGVEYRWVTVDGYYCDGYAKYSKERKQAYRNNTWQNTNEYRKGEVIEEYSEDCGAELKYRWEPTGKTVCNGYALSSLEVYLVSRDMGNTWLNVEPVEYREVETSKFSELCIDSVEPFTFIPNNQVKVDYIYMGATSKDPDSSTTYNVDYYVDWGEGRKHYHSSSSKSVIKVQITDEIPLTDHEIKIWGNITFIGRDYYDTIAYFQYRYSELWDSPTDITEITNWGEIVDETSFRAVIINGYYGTKIAKPKFDKPFKCFAMYNVPYLESLPFSSFGAVSFRNCNFTLPPEITTSYFKPPYDDSPLRGYYNVVMENCNNFTNVSIKGITNAYINCDNIEEIQLNGEIYWQDSDKEYGSALDGLEIRCPKLKTISGTITQPKNNKGTKNEDLHIWVEIHGDNTDVNNFTINVRGLNLNLYGVKNIPYIYLDEELDIEATDLEVLDLDKIVMSVNTKDNWYQYPGYGFGCSGSSKLTTITGTLKPKKTEADVIYYILPTDVSLNFDSCKNLKLISPILRDWNTILTDGQSLSDWISFSGCTSLLTIPNDFFGDNIKLYLDKPYIPKYMFSGCTSLTNYPVKGGVPMWKWPIFYKDAITDALTFANCPLIASEVPVQWGGTKFEQNTTELTVTLDSSNLTYNLGKIFKYGNKPNAIVDWGDGNIEFVGVETNDGDYARYTNYQYIGDYSTVDPYPEVTDITSHTYATPGTYNIKLGVVFVGNLPYITYVNLAPNVPTIYNKIGEGWTIFSNLDNVSYLNTIDNNKTLDQIYLVNKYYSVGDNFIPLTLSVGNVYLKLLKIPDGWLNGGLKNNHIGYMNLKLNLNNIDLSGLFINCPGMNSFYLYIPENASISFYLTFKNLKNLYDLNIYTFDINNNNNNIYTITDATEAFYGSDLYGYNKRISNCQKAVRAYANSRLVGNWDDSYSYYILSLGDITTPDMTECFMNTPIEHVSINSVASGVNLTRCFADCQQLEEIPKVGDKYLWEIPGLIGTECFKGCVKLDMSIIPDDWK